MDVATQTESPLLCSRCEESIWLSESTKKQLQRSNSLLPDDTIIKKNLEKCREEIIDCLDPMHAQLTPLIFSLKLDDAFRRHNIPRGEQAELLLKKVEETERYSELLLYVENNDHDEHIGHTHVALLLRGESYAERNQVEIQASKVIWKRIKKSSGFIMSQLQTYELLPHLIACKLITFSEGKELESIKVPQNSAFTLLAILRTKGPTAVFPFLDCLAEEEEHVHYELYQQIIGSSRKRKTFSGITDVLVPKRHPCNFQVPHGLTGEFYKQNMSKIRKQYTGFESKTQVAKIISEIEKIITCSQNYPLEVRIAFKLEQCYLSTDIERIKDIVADARKECDELENIIESECSVRILRGRCEWVLAQCYRKNGMTKEADRHLSEAFSEMYFFKEGEDNILVNYVCGCCLLTSDHKLAKQHFKKAITLAQQESYGMDVAQYCKINLAHACINSSADNPVASDVNITPEDTRYAMEKLEELDQTTEDIKPRARFLFLVARADVYRVAGQMEKASKDIEQAIKNASTHAGLSSIIMSATKRKVLYF